MPESAHPHPDPSKAPQAETIFGVQKPIFWLGIVSFLTDVSSEMIFSILSIFLTVILGASTVILGTMEGLADFAASSLDFVSGYLSDKTGKRKIFALFGYGFSTLAKCLLVFVSNVAGVFSFRVIERLGKSIRGAPRDALISSLSEKSKLGFSFGFHKMLDKTGAVLGPFIAYFLLSAFGQNSQTFQLLFIVAVIPALLSVLILGIFVKDKPAPSRTRQSIFKLYKESTSAFKKYLKVAGFFSLAYFSFAFLMLKAYQVGFQIKDIVLLYALFNVAFTLISIPIGKIGDKIGRNKIILAEFIIYALMCLGFIFATTKLTVGLLFLVYGIFYAIDEGQTKAFISDISSEETRASSIGLYNFITGMIYLPASLIAGFLWSQYGSAATFLFAGAIALISAVAFKISAYHEAASHR